MEGIMKDELMNVFLMGLGAVGLTTEKAQELQSELLKKGTEMFEGTTVINEELKHNIKCSLNSDNKINSNEEIINKIRNFSDEEKRELLSMLKEVENVTNMQSMFENQYELDSIGDISKWNVSNVTNMNYMFKDCEMLVCDVSDWKFNKNVTMNSFNHRAKFVKL